MATLNRIEETIWCPTKREQFLMSAPALTKVSDFCHAYHNFTKIEELDGEGIAIPMFTKNGYVEVLFEKIS